MEQSTVPHFTAEETEARKNLGSRQVLGLLSSHQQPVWVSNLHCPFTPFPPRGPEESGTGSHTEWLPEKAELRWPALHHCQPDPEEQSSSLMCVRGFPQKRLGLGKVQTCVWLSYFTAICVLSKAEGALK